MNIEKSLQELEEHENKLIANLEKHIFFKKILSIDDEVFNSCLLQRRYISHLYTPVYDLAIDHLDSKESKIIARKILGEEYPDNKDEPSHRELLVEDMMKIGIDRDKYYIHHLLNIH